MTIVGGCVDEGIEGYRPPSLVCARKLCEINNAQSLTSKSSNRSDTSQKGDWSNYRNEFYEGKALTLSSAFFADCPSRGRLTFDFVSTRRPKRSTKALSTKRFLSLCKVLGLGELERVSRFYGAMNPVRRNLASFYHGNEQRVGVGSRRRDYGVEVDDEDDTPLRLPLLERRRPVNGVLVRYFRFSHCAAFIISSKNFLFAFFVSDLFQKRPSWRGRAVAGPLCCLLYTSPSPRDLSTSRMPSSA